MIPWPLLLLKAKSVLSWAIAHILLVLLGIAILWIAVLTYQRNHARTQARSNALAVDSAVAASSRTVERSTESRVRKILGDSLRLFERRTVQAEMRADATDKALGTMAVAIHDIVNTINTSHTQTTANVADSADVRRSVFQVRDEPYTATATVALPRPPLKGSLDLKIVTDSIKLGVRLSCGEPVRGIKPASIVVTTPQWMHAEIQGGQQSPELCNPVVQHGKSKGVSKWWVFGGTVVGGLIGAAASH